MGWAMGTTNQLDGHTTGWAHNWMGTQREGWAMGMTNGHTTNDTQRTTHNERQQWINDRDRMGTQREGWMGRQGWAMGTDGHTTRGMERQGWAMGHDNDDSTGPTGRPTINDKNNRQKQSTTKTINNEQLSSGQP